MSGLTLLARWVAPFLHTIENRPIMTVSTGIPLPIDSIFTVTSIELVPVYVTCPLILKSRAGFRGESLSTEAVKSGNHDPVYDREHGR